MIHQDNKHDFDVAILGSGLSGSLLGSILGKQGVRVVLIDGGVHPRFEVGESTIPHTSLLLSLLAEKYGMPEIAHIAYPARLAAHVCTSCGIKRSFGFAFHREGEIYDSRHGHQFGTSSKDENHWFRQDIDSYLFHLAIHYGAVPRQRTKVVGVDIDTSVAVVRTDSGEEIRAKYVVDGTGFRSVLAAKFNLRETPTRLKHHSRTIFTHMVDIPAFQEGRNPLTLSWAQNTLHHCFEGGWFWVIPFNNHERSTNPLTSVGITMDPRRYPASGPPPEQEFQQFLDRFPSVQEQFATGRAVRPWVSTGRLQYSSRKCVGFRYCLMSHAAGFVDPLFSRGMINTLEVISALLDPLLEAVTTDNFDEQAFAHIERLQQRVLDYNDQLVNAAFVSWADFDLWNAWLRVWGLGTILTEFRVMNALADYTATRLEKHFTGETQNPVFSKFEDPDYAGFFARAVGLMGRFEMGTLSAGEAAEGIFKMTEEYEFPVVIRLDALLRAGWVLEDMQMTDRDVEFARSGFRWALANPDARDLFGTPGNLFRWQAHCPDPHLAAPLSGVRS
jgi:tetracycline 7-halogenase / FADH2 O2-dependent halogenase